MKTSSSVFALAVSSTALFASSWVSAQEWSFQPRVNVGVMNYEFNQEDAIRISASIALDGSGAPAVTVESLKGVKRSANLPYIGVGGTISYDKLFLDLYGFKTGTGEDNGISQSSTTNVTWLNNSFTSYLDIKDNSEIDREEYSISLGYNLVDSLILFAGYKKSKTEFNDKIPYYEFSGFLNGKPVSYITSNGILNIDLDQKGPFIGAAYGWNIMDKGILSINAALGFFDGDVKQFGRINIPNVQENLPYTDRAFIVKGDVVGLTTGINWRGSITDNLAYSLALSGYSYNYEGKNGGGDFSESVLNFSAGLAYRF